MKEQSKKKTASMNKKAIALWLAVAIVVLVISFAIIFFTAQKRTTFGGKREQQCVSDYMGLTEEQARQRARDYNISVIVTDNNPGGAYKPAMIPRPAVYLRISNGVVTNVKFGNYP